MKQAVAITCLFAGILFESMLWDDQIMQSPDELTVSEFERAENGLSVVLTNAIEDQRAVVDYMQERQEVLARCRMQAQTVGNEAVCDGFNEKCIKADQVMFQAMRVLGLLEATREREAGRLV